MRSIISLLFLTLLLNFPAHATSEEAMLVAADGYRLVDDQARIQVSIITYRNQQVEKKKDYSVYIRPNHHALVDFQSAQEKGQRLLMKGDHFWLYSPRSKRAVRITPIQKLLGEASAGDITNMRWVGAYKPTLAPNATINGKTMTVLNLKSIRQGNTYDTLQLFLEPETHRPMQADLYVRSGKKAKTAIYHYSKDTKVVNRIILQDNINEQKHTEMIFSDQRPYQLPDKYFNVQFLKQHRNRPITQ